MVDTPRAVALPFTWNPGLFTDLPDPVGLQIALFRVQRSMAGTVWDAAQLEGDPFTFPEIQTLMDGTTVGGRKVSDEVEVRGLIESTRRLHASVGDGSFATTASYLRSLHRLVASVQPFDAGLFRGEGDVVTDISVDLGERATRRPSPTVAGGKALVAEYEAGLAAIDSLAGPVQRALALKCLIARGQFFYDGNKRTSRHMMNGVLMSAGHHAISVPAARRLDYNAAMVDQHADGESGPVVKLLLEEFRAAAG